MTNEGQEFNLTIQVRKIAQKSLAPLIKKIQDQVQKVSFQASEVCKQNERVSVVQKQLGIASASIRQFSTKLSQFVGQLAFLKSQDGRNALICKKNIDNLSQQINAMKQQTKRKEQKVVQAVKKVEQITAIFTKHQQTTDKTIESFKNKLTEIYSQSVAIAKESTDENKQYFEKMKLFHQKLERQQEKFMKTSNVIALYQQQRDENLKKVRQCLEKIKKCPTYDEFQQLKQQTHYKLNQVNRLEKEVEKLPTQKHIDEINDKIRKIEQQMKLLVPLQKFECDTSNFKKWVDNQHDQIHFHIEKVKNDLEEFKLKDKIEEQLKLKQQDRKIFQLFNTLGETKEYLIREIKITQNKLIEQKSDRNELPDRENKLKQQIICQIQNIKNTIVARCVSIQSLGSNLQNNLAIFGNRISRIRTDNELFYKSIKRQIELLEKNKNEIDINFITVGQILSKCMELISMIYSISLYEDLKYDRQPQKTIIVTYNDGIICQIDKKQNEQQPKLYYRRKKVNTINMKKAVLATMGELVDKIIIDNMFLKWNENKPSLFYKQFVVKKYDTMKQKIINRKNQSYHHASSNYVTIDVTNKPIDLLKDQYKDTILDLSAWDSKQKEKQSVSPPMQSENISLSKSKLKKKNKSKDNFENKQKSMTLTHKTRGQSKKSYNITTKKTYMDGLKQENSQQITFLTARSRSGRYSKFSHLG